MKPVVENKLLVNQFFLTRQTANLMEDFAREIVKSSSIYLLYGVASVGKSRLLQELANRGIAEHKFCWIDLKSDSTESSPAEGTSGTDSDAFVEEIQELMEVADERDVILVDHFELASNKARHQLFQSWSTDGIDKKINLIITTTTGSFSDVRQLAQHYKIRIKSFQLMPCSKAEVEAFLSFYLFPSNPLDALSIPADMKAQLRSCNGILGKVIEVADQRGAQVSIIPESDLDSKNRIPVAAGVLLVILAVIGISYRYWQPDFMEEPATPVQTEKTITIISDNEDIVSINQSEPEQSEATTEGGQSSLNPQLTDKNEEAIKTADEELQATEIRSDLKSSNENGDQALTRFQLDLKKTLDWIEGQDKSRATIQIMTISSGESSGEAYHRYLDKLVSKNINVSEIRIYQTKINGAVAFGVLYGDYENRREANTYIQQLPEGLNAKQPIPRTIGGIWNEIKNQ